MYLARGNVCLRHIGSGHRPGEFRDSEIENLYVIGFGDEDVLGFQIAMNNSFIVRGSQSMRQLNRVINRFACRQRLLIEEVTQSLAFE